MKTNLQSLRKKAGFRSAKAFAQYLGMPVGTYTDYEQGRRSFTLEKAWEFADALHCTIDELAGRDFKPRGEALKDPYERELVGIYRDLGAKGKAHVIDAARGQNELEKKTQEGSQSPAEGEKLA